MREKIYFFDTSLRDGEQSPGCSMNKREKLILAKQLERLGVDVIEAGFAAASEGDFESIREIASEIKDSTIAVLARTVKSDIDKAYQAVKMAKKPRIHTFIATSDIHMEYKLKMTKEEVMQRAEEMVKYASSLVPEVEFSAEDATRSSTDFLAEIFDKYYEFIMEIREKSKYLDTVIISVHCHNDLGLAVANTLAALKAGARQFECTMNGIGERAGNAALEELAMILKTRKDIYDFETNIVTEEISRTSNLLSSITGVHVQPNKAIVGANAFAHESGIHQHGMLSNRETYEIMTPESIGLKETKMVLGKHSGRHAFRDRIKSLGFDLDEEEINQAFQKFKDLADQKKVIYDSDIEVILTRGAKLEDAKYKLKRFVVNAGNTISTIASVVLDIDGEEVEGIASAGGPIDSAIRAIEKCLDMDLTMEDYSLQSITEGTDAIGYATVKLKYGEDHYSGRDASVDVVEASINAYLDAVNKI